MDGAVKVRRPGLWLTAITLAAGGVAAWLFPRALPTLALHQRLTRQEALARADSFFRAHDLAPPGARMAVRFESNDSLETYVELSGGGGDTLQRLLARSEVPLFVWSVRAFVPGSPREARADFAPDGRLLGFRRVLADSDARPELTVDSARGLAERVLSGWIRQDTARWRLVSSSYVTRPTSGRVDRTFTFQRRGLRIGQAPLRVDVVIAGDTPSATHPYVVIPQSFHRRYGDMRSANDLLALIAQSGMLVLLIAAAFVLKRFGSEGRVRWKPALVVGAVVGMLIMAAGLNQLPGSWFDYDTATSPATFLATLVLDAVLSGAGFALLVGLTLAAAEAAARRAFPQHLDWWGLWTHRGTREVAGRVAGGYATAAVGFAYVALFYLVTRKLLGWWVPTELVDDPNLIATPLPWLSGVALSLQAGVWEESLFRALPLSLLAIWVGERPHRARWMALGVVVTALVFGFAHSNYTSWPPYSRGAEIFLEACLWGTLFLVFGLLVTVLAHFLYDLVLFGSFATAGSAFPYRVTAAVVALVLLAPALSVAWRWLRQRSLVELPAEGRFVAWKPGAPRPRVDLPPTAPQGVGTLSRAARRLALLVVAAAVPAAVLLPGQRTLGPPFTVGRARALAVADSVLATRGVNPARWRRLALPVTRSQRALRTFLVEEHATSLAPRLATRYAPPAWWQVRYVHTAGTPAERAEEWSVALRPDGTPIGVRHVLPDSAARPSVSDAEAARIARAALARAGFDTLALERSDLRQTARPQRQDVTLTYTDTLLRLPDRAQARASVTVAGEEALSVSPSVDLPQTFVRTLRERTGTRNVLIAVCAVLFLAVLTASGVLAVRRGPPVLPGAAPGRRAVLIGVGALVLLGVARDLNSLPETLATYSTALPWGNFLGMTVVAMLLSPVAALLAYALWLVVDALRRRVGIPVLPDSATGATRRDVLLAGVGLGALPTALGLLRALVPAGLPAAPTTLLGTVVPALGPALSLPMQVVMGVAAVAAPFLVVAAASRRTPVRAVLAALLFLPLLGIVLATTPPTADPWARGAAFTAGAVLVVWLWLACWARCCAWSWIVAGLVASALDALHRGIHAATPSGHAGGWVMLAAALLLLALAMVPAATRAAERLT